MAKISVIIPTYKPGKYIEKCLISIASQSYKDFDVIIILNGCNEPYYSQIIKYLKKHNLYSKTYLFQTDRSGVSNARNIGIENSDGDYIVFIDDDDIISKEYLQGLIDVASFSTISVSNIKRLVNGYLESNHSASFTYLQLFQNGYKNLFKSRQLLNGPWMKLYPREIIGTFRFDTSISLGEDALFNFAISRNIESLVATNPSSIYYYNYRIGSSWTNVRNRNLVSHLFKLLYKYFIICLSAPCKYNFIFFLNRIIAITKTFISQIVKNCI